MVEVQGLAVAAVPQTRTISVNGDERALTNNIAFTVEVTTNAFNGVVLNGHTNTMSDSIVNLGYALTNNQTGVTLAGAFSGDGNGMTNLPYSAIANPPTIPSQGITNNQTGVDLGLALTQAATTTLDTTPADNELSRAGWVREQLSALALRTFYGSTNAHPTIAGAASLSDTVPATIWTNVSTHAAIGTNLVGTYWSTNPIFRIPQGQFFGRPFIIGAGGGTKAVRMQLVCSTNGGVSTNVLATSVDVAAPTSISSVRITMSYTGAAIEETNTYLGVRYYTIRSTAGGGSGTVTTYGGGIYDTSLETPGGTALIDLGVRGATNIVFSGHTAVYDAATRTITITTN